MTPSNLHPHSDRARGTGQKGSGGQTPDPGLPAACQSCG